MNVRAYTETDGKHDKGVWEERQLWKTLRKLGKYEEGENADMETARHCKLVYERDRSVSTRCHIILNMWTRARNRSL
jgi:hypothetical protein